ncbi:MAG TPA: hypothetical protein VMR89_08480 [Actinomycetota bacterium]|nr:hypothetical protein [Actinomycetota bacterium]
MRSRRLRLIMSLLVVAVALVGTLPAPVLGQELTASRVRVTLTSLWVKPSPDPTGLAYHRGQRQLLVVDSEVEETRRWAGANIWRVRLGGRVSRSWSLMRFTREPTDIAFKDRRILFISDDNEDRVFRVQRGPDKIWGTRDDAITSFPTRPFGSRDPEGLEVALGSVWVADGESARIYRVRPGRDGRFNGAPPVGDDVVTSFDTLGLGLRDPEDLVYDGATGLLYLVSAKDDVIVRTTRAGVLVDTIDLSPFGLIAPAGITLAPGSRDRSVRNVYISDRGIDNGPDPNENDGRIFEFALTAA